MGGKTFFWSLKVMHKKLMFTNERTNIPSNRSENFNRWPFAFLTIVVVPCLLVVSRSALFVGIAISFLTLLSPCRSFSIRVLDLELIDVLLMTGWSNCRWNVSFFIYKKCMVRLHTIDQMWSDPFPGPRIGGSFVHRAAL